MIGRNENFHEEHDRIMKAYQNTGMLYHNPCWEVSLGTGGECILGDSDYIITLYNPNKLLLIC